MTDLPAGWIRTTIGEVAEYVQRGRGPTYVERSNLPVINQKCIRWDGVDPEYIKYVAETTRAQWSTERLLRRGDILWNSTGTGTLGRAAVFDGLAGFEDVVVDSHVTIVRLRETEPRYVCYWIRSPVIQGRLEQMQSGSTNQVELPRSEVVATELPLPPVGEQLRIVAKLDAIFEQTRASKARLKRLPALLENLKRAILSAAFRGDLTKGWRAAHPDVEPASALLHRIRTERRREWEVSLRDKGKDPMKAQYVTYEPDNVELLPALPSGWAWAGMSEVAELQLGQRRAPEYQGETEFPYVRAANITWRGLDLTDIKTMGFVDTERLFLRRGDVLLSEASGSAKEVGKPGIWRDEIPNCCFQATVLRLRPDPRVLDGEWLYLSCLADAVLGRFAAMAPGIGILHLTAERMRKWPVPIPPVAERTELAKQLAEALERLYATEDRANGFQNWLERLEQTVLAKTFRGELVHQDPTEEPASEFVARLLAERDNADAELLGRRPQTPKKRTSMSNGDKDSIKAAILKLKPERFSFDELRAQVAGDYESLRTALFELLEEPTPLLRQTFDKKSKAMVLVRVRA